MADDALQRGIALQSKQSSDRNKNENSGGGIRGAVEGGVSGGLKRMGAPDGGLSQAKGKGLGQRIQMGQQMAASAGGSAGGSSMGGDASRLSDSSQGGGQASVLDLPKKSYTDNQSQDAGNPYAGGGLQESQLERSKDFMSGQQQSRQNLEQFSGAGASQAGGSTGEGMGNAGYEETMEEPEGDYDGFAYGDEGEDGGGDEAAFAQHQQRMQASRAMQLEQKQQGNRSQAEQMQSRVEQAQKLAKSLKRIGKIFRWGDIATDILGMPEDGGGMSGPKMFFVMNLVVINHHTLKLDLTAWLRQLGITKDVQEPEFAYEVLTVCMDCGLMGMLPFIPPCCYVTIPVIFLLCVLAVLQNIPGFALIVGHLGEVTKVFKH